MRILAIETSCDETAAALVDAAGNLQAPQFDKVASALQSQIAIHAQYGGVFPALAKREHSKNIVPVLMQTLGDAQLLQKRSQALTTGERAFIAAATTHEKELTEPLTQFLSEYAAPIVDYLAVTHGPGLEPALWVGINTAQVLSTIWKIPLIGVNHMEGHVISPLLNQPEPIAFPAVALIASGGHTELLEVERWGSYRLLGETRDDAVGEAFDKVARMLGLPYPGGPVVSQYAQVHREQHPTWTAETDPEGFVSLPRPMIHSVDFDFSFSGLKTAVLYYFRNLSEDEQHSEITIQKICRAFEDAAVEVLVSKTMRACEESAAQSLIIGGGVIANTHLRTSLTAAANQRNIALHMPSPDLATDNAVMIAMAAYLHTGDATVNPALQARGRMPLGAKR
jgi:N6-L-threonylcarbamoyladenine synthase